ncbi:MAG: tetratricopeptide repeat protein, partial [Gloeobacteraceae cyanobacterium ES-bin-144]|nr:tetratricopeptide repeat protein [Verrucomicrobiales bacterium]
FIPIRSGPIADYYLVFPGIGLAVALAGFASALIQSIKRNKTNHESYRPLIAGALLCLVGFWRLLCIPMFWLQTSLWNRPLDLYLSVDLTRPAQFHAQSLAARELYDIGKFKQAKELARKSLDLAPWDPFSRLTLGLVALQDRDFNEAEMRFSEVVKMNSVSPSYPDFARYHLAKIYMEQDSKRHLVKETLLPLLANLESTSHMGAIFLQIECYQKQNQLSDALRAAQKGANLHPDNLHLAILLKEIETQISDSPAAPHAPEGLNPTTTTPESSKH